MASMAITNTSEELNEKILELLECPVCYEHILPPIYQCFTGHIICSKCSIKMGTCPTCRQSLMHGTKCLFAEQVARLMTFPCHNADAGCLERNTLDNLEKHEGRCPYRTYSCIPGKNLGCKWRGNPNQILDHVKKDHPDIRISLNHTDVYTIPSHPAQTVYVNEIRIDLIHSFGQTFYLYTTVDQYSSDYIIAVQFVGSGEDSLKYLYHVELFTPDARRSITFTNPAMSIDEDIMAVITFSVDTVRIDTNKLHNLRNSDGSMSFRIKIEEIADVKNVKDITDVEDKENS